MPSPSKIQVKTLRVRIKDRHAKALRELACEVNLVWNFSQDLALKVLEREPRFMSAFDLAPFTQGASKEGLNLHSQTVQAVSEEYGRRRAQFKKRKLRWRVSSGARRSLGWIPFKASAIRDPGGPLRYGKMKLGVWDSYGLSGFHLGTGSWSEDARGRWYANITVKIPELCGPGRPPPTASVGIDLGLRELAAFSDPRRESIQAPQFYRDLEPKLAKAQRAGKKVRTQALHAKIKNRRKDFLNKLAHDLVKNYGVIVVGDVSPSQLAKTKRAKSVLDCGWGTFKTPWMHQSQRAATVFKEVSEAYSTQDCNACGARAGPRGQAGLGVTCWTCPGCGAVHDRNRNAAANILAWGLHELAEDALKTSMNMNVNVKAGACGASMNKPECSGGPGIRPLDPGILGL